MSVDRDKRYNTPQEDRILKKGTEQKPNEANNLDAAQKGIQLFFGDKERAFFENAGKEITNQILQETFLLYRVDYKRTRTHDLYGESKTKVWLPTVEVSGRIDVASDDPEYLVKGGVIRKGFGRITAHIYTSHLDELGATIRMGDFLYHKGNFYEVIDDGSANISNEHAFGGDKLFYITIKGVEVNSDVFKAK